MSRYDKYSGVTGGFRARLAADFAYTATNPDYTHVDLDKTFAMGMNSTGQVGKYLSAGFAAGTFCGVMILTKPKAAGDVVDIMTDGEIVELVDAEVLAATVLAGGMKLYADTAGGTAGLLAGPVERAVNDYYVGRTAEINTTTGRARLIVRCSFTPEAA